LLASRLFKARAVPRPRFAPSISRSAFTVEAPAPRREFAENSAPRGPPTA